MEKTGDAFTQVLWLQVLIDWSIWEHLENNSYKFMSVNIFSIFQASCYLLFWQLKYKVCLKTQSSQRAGE